jgi:hypothetical protein
MAQRGARTRSRKTTARKSGKKSSRRIARVTLLEAPAATRKAVLEDIRRVLANRGVEGQLVALQLKCRTTTRRRVAVVRTARVGVAKTSAAPPAALALVCPPGTRKVVSCFFRNGTFVCEERCVPR